MKKDGDKVTLTVDEFELLLGKPEALVECLRRERKETAMVILLNLLSNAKLARDRGNTAEEYLDGVRDTIMRTHKITRQEAIEFGIALEI